MSTTSLDIFELLKQFNKESYQYFSQLSDDHRKAFQPLLVMRWASGTTDPVQLLMLNELINPVCFQLHAHKELLWNLLCVCSPKTPCKYQWIKGPASKKPSPYDALLITSIREHFTCSSKEAVDIISVLSIQQLVELLSSIGLQSDEIKKVVKQVEKIKAVSSEINSLVIT